MPELFFDVETTGLPGKKANPEEFGTYDKCRVVSIAWVLRDEKTVYSQRYSVVDPGIPDEEIGAEFIHGISRDIVDRHGQPVESVIHEFMDDVEKSDIIVAHNIQFDKGVVASELFRMGCSEKASVLTNFEHLCTMRSTTNLVKIKNAFGSYKWPKLEELYEFLFGAKFENAHHAMCDVDALVSCYYKLVKSESYMLRK